MVGLAKARPGAVSYATPGSGTGIHLTTELFMMIAGIKMTHVPYKGGAPATMDLIAGNVAVMFNNATTTVPHVGTGKLRALAVSTAKRSPALPDVVTIAEAGYPGFESNSWQGIVTRIGTPPAIITRLNGEVVRILGLPDVRNINQNLGNEDASGTPEAFLAYIRTEMEKWGKVIKAAGVTNQ
jgi:tripartite-type tricarboxylate transporter receptor subunit TctC